MAYWSEGVNVKFKHFYKKIVLKLKMYINWSNVFALQRLVLKFQISHPYLFNSLKKNKKWKRYVVSKRGCNVFFGCLNDFFGYVFVLIIFFLIHCIF